MKARILLAIVALLALVSGTAIAADVAGTWKASMPGRDGATVETTFTFAVEGDKLTGSVTSSMGGGTKTDISDGSVSGDTIKFKVKREFGGQTRIMNYEGQVSGNEIKFKSSIEGSERPPREFTAKKVS